MPAGGCVTEPDLDYFWKLRMSAKKFPRLKAADKTKLNEFTVIKGSIKYFYIAARHRCALMCVSDYAVILTSGFLY